MTEIEHNDAYVQGAREAREGYERADNPYPATARGMDWDRGWISGNRSRKFKVGDRVVPIAYTKDDLTYGYVREVTPDRGYRVYWPEISTDGDGWWDHDFEGGR